MVNMAVVLLGPHQTSYKPRILLAQFFALQLWQAGVERSRFYRENTAHSGRCQVLSIDLDE